ncbi:hypothetical protein [Streptomyces sp. CAU 1734]|uniref:hypothetical protein n=1 Tax=Streptomyces sp. CAU 1734 TaxID=3140360 RepID=UPI003261A3C9
MQPKTLARPWHVTLTDSARALGESAEEYRRAIQAGVVLQLSVSPLLRNVITGQAGALQANGRPHPFHPHEQSIFRLDRAYGQQTGEIRGWYADAALLYASGVAWAIREVQAGRTPDVVCFPTDPAGHRVEHDRMDVDPGRASTAPLIAAAYQRLTACTDAAGVMLPHWQREGLAGRQARDRNAGLNMAGDIADAAYAYGRTIEGLLRSVIRDANAAAAAPAPAPAGESG